MCGRFTLAMPDPAQIRARFPIGDRLEVRRRYNVAPGDDVLAVVRCGPSAEGALLRWGLVPHWATDPREVGVRTINSRAETIAERPAFRDAFARRRCLVVADGFYEWSGGTPYWITREDGEPFAFAGLWASWRPSAGDRVEPLRTCSIVTTVAAGPVRALHDRMPVILRAGDEPLWLDPQAPADAVHELLAPAGPALVTRPVSRAVNDARHDDADCLGPPEQAALF
jgi:putative SOS response-associated peptidase YedK